MANTLWSSASLAARDAPLLVAFSRARGTVLGGGQQELGSFLWAMGKLGYEETRGENVMLKYVELRNAQQVMASIYGFQCFSTVSIVKLIRQRP